MSHWVTTAIVIGVVAALVRLLAWLAGLWLILRGTAPHERPAILRAYAACLLRIPPKRRDIYTRRTNRNC